MHASRFLAAAGICLTALPTAADAKLDDRFYFAPMASHGFFESEGIAGRVVDIDDEFGGTLAIGRPLNRWLNLEGYAFLFDDVRAVECRNEADIDIEGFGIDALLFPARDKLPVFGIVGMATGNYDLDGTVAGQSGKLDADYLDVGVGFLVPLNRHGIALRGEYRRRRADVQAENASDPHFDDDIVSLGLQIPLGAAPTRAEPMPAPEVPEIVGVGDAMADPGDEPPVSVGPIVLEGVHFEFDSAKLTPEAERRLDEAVAHLEAGEPVDVRIEGHTDSIGTHSYNQLLSERRAASVKNYLVEQGIAADRLTVRGFGETRPVAPNTQEDGSDDPEGRARNRRVEMHPEE